MTRKELPCYHCGWEQAHGENHRGKCPDHPDNRNLTDDGALIPVGTYVYRFMGVGAALRRDIARYHAKQV